MEILSQNQYLTALQGSLYVLLMLCSLVIVLICSRRCHSYIPAFKYLKRTVIAMGLWASANATFFLSPDTKLLPNIMPYTYATVSFCGPLFLIFAFSYVFPLKTHHIKYLYLLQVFPCIVTVMLVFQPLHKYIVVFTNELIYIPYRYINEHPQPLFKIFIIYEVINVLVGILFLSFKAFKSPETATIGSKIAILASIIFVFQSSLIAFGVQTGNFFWLLPISATICLILFFYTLYYDNSEQIILKGQSMLLETMPFPILILNNRDIVIYTNNLGDTIFSSVRNLNRQTISRDDILQQYTIFETDSLNQEGMTQLFIQQKDTGQLLLLQELVTDYQHKNNWGRMMMLIPMSYIQNLFNTLESKAFHDSLCQCYNRHFLECKLSESLTKERLPVSILMCDLDNLKKINDQLGHHRGDTYLITCHNEIRASIRKDDLLFRIGGDEFLVILQKVSSAVAQRIARTIEERVARHTEFKPYKVGISVGTSTITSPDINFKDCIKEADQDMYRRKQTHKKEET